MPNPFGRMSNFWEVVGEVGGEVTLNRLRHPPGSVATAAARAADRSDTAKATATTEAASNDSSTAEPPSDSSSAEAPSSHPVVEAGKTALRAVATAMNAMTELEQALSAPLAGIKTPGFPALRAFDMAVGLPHAHNHPPNVTPPNPVPLFLPSVGWVQPTPFVSCASTTLINNLSAARCGDMGPGVWCGGYFPLFEVFLGSSSVWIEGARAARVGVDITKHCVFSAPRPQDPPLGPMMGSTVQGSPNVLIGGVPMPSLTSMAIGLAFRTLFRGVGGTIRRLGAKRYIDRLIKHGKIKIHSPPHAPDFDWLVRKDLVRIARTRAGRALLKNMQKSGKNLNIHFDAPNPPNAWGWSGGHADSYFNHTSGKPGPGADGSVGYDPLQWPNANGPNSPSDAILFHEMQHADNGMNGRLNQQSSTDPDWNGRWQDYEEYSAVNAEDGYRYERSLINPPQRRGYGALP